LATGISEILWHHARLFRPDRDKNPDWQPLTKARCYRPDPEHLQRFRELCRGWDHAAWLPPTYPQVVAADLHLQLFGSRAFPFNPMGLVHYSNHIELSQALPVECDYQLKARLLPGGMHPRGVLVQVETELHCGDARVWRSVATALRILKHRPSSAPVETSADAVIDTCVTDSMDLPEDLGRRYARIAGDLNPIHQRAWMARPFGFRRAIIHGMWTFAWAIQPLLSARPEEPASLEAVFARPVLLPARIHLSMVQDCPAERQGRVWTSAPGKPNLLFHIRPGHR